MAQSFKIKNIPGLNDEIQACDSIYLQRTGKKEKYIDQYLEDKDQKKSQDGENDHSQAPFAEKDRKTIQNNRWLVDWSPQEDNILFKKYLELGSKWSQLARFLPNKSDNAIKNRFNCCVRKVQRKMNKVQKLKKIKHRKQIKFETLLTFLEIGKIDCLQFDKRLVNAAKNISQIMEVRDIIIEQAKKQEADIKDKDIQDLLTLFLDVKYSLKFMNAKRVKKGSKNDILSLDKQSTAEPSFLQQENQEEQPQNISENEKRDLNGLLDFENLNPDYLDAEIIKKEPTLIDDYQIIFNLDLSSEKFDYQFFMRS